MRPTIALGTNIYRLRKEARLTQDDLATHLGVTKSSVSKWETGQSYPDIELLPKIAAFFDTSVDRLMGYEPQMGKEGIARECARLRATFASAPFDEAHAESQQLVHDYYSCYPLLVQIALLYLNHLDLAEETRRMEFANEAIDLCRRVCGNSKSSADIRLAQAVEAALYLATGKPQAAVEALDEKPDVDLGTDILLASAYAATGQVDEADKTLQGALVQSLVLSLNRLAQLALLWTSNPDELDRLHVAHDRALALVNAFDMEGLYVNTVAIHLSFAMAYVAVGDTERALDCLEDYERASRRLEFPLELHGDKFFDRAQAWLEDVNVIGTSVPRDEALLKRSLLEGVAANPSFATLAHEPRFIRIVKNLEEVTR